MLVCEFEDHTCRAQKVNISESMARIVNDTFCPYLQ